MKTARVLVVDDSVVVRQIVTEVLSQEPDLDVVSTASNGRFALAKIQQLNPDIVTLDIEMPELNGLDTLKELRRTHPHLPVVMFSTVTTRGALATLDALSLGANDYATKPSDAADFHGAVEHIRNDLIPKLRALVDARSSRQGRSRADSKPKSRLSRRSDSRGSAEHKGEREPVAPIETVLIGASTGGPVALTEVLSGLPHDLPVPVLIVQHMPPLFTRHLAERLASKSGLDVREGRQGEVVAPGMVRLAPGDRHMMLYREGQSTRIALNDDPPENSCRPSVDVLLRSGASVFGAGTLSVVLTGMGRDGARGSEWVRTSGGQVVVQDEATSVVWGMPGAVVEMGLADTQVPLGGVAREIIKRVRGGRSPQDTLPSLAGTRNGN